MPRVYLDHNATSPLRGPARAKMLDALRAAGNPSSIHAEGRAARALVEAAREKVAALVGGRARNVIFASGATEALNLALSGRWRGPQGAATKLLLSATEHVAALDGHGFGENAEILPVDGAGVLDLAALDAALARAEGPVLLCLQAANNETGVLQPVAAAAEKVRAAGGLVVCDAVQAAGRIACAFDTTGADMLVVSSHKIGGPQGAGALVLRDAALHCDRPLIRGGGQERGFRAGTENVAALAGFGAAAEDAAAHAGEEAVRLSSLREKLETELARLAPGATVFSAGAPRLPNTTAFAIPGLSAETALMALDLAGVALSSGSACSSGKVKRSHVLAAMGIPDDLARGALRASLGWTTTEQDVAAFSAALGGILARIGRKTAV
ncbi:MAG TPA: cysteine desulfurase family protein [Rhodoblastus sp.]|nr:cysteine desulfurase family protein [Rhodoblastus sp.]